MGADKPSPSDAAMDAARVYLGFDVGVAEIRRRATETTGGYAVHRRADLRDVECLARVLDRFAASREADAREDELERICRAIHDRSARRNPEDSGASCRMIADDLIFDLGIDPCRTCGTGTAEGIKAHEARRALARPPAGTKASDAPPESGGETPFGARPKDAPQGDTPIPVRSSGSEPDHAPTPGARGCPPHRWEGSPYMRCRLCGAEGYADEIFSPPGKARTPTVEEVAEAVRDAWVEWARRQPNPKASWLVPWAECDEQTKDADYAIARAMRALFAAKGAE